MKEGQMKILGICGTNSRKKDSPSEWFLAQAMKGAESEGAETEMIRLIRYNIQPCSSCHMCMCVGKCHLLEDKKDDGAEVFDKIFKADGIIFSSPVYSYQAPAIVINLIQRSRCFHEIERGRWMGIRNVKKTDNPYSGKPIGNLAISATIGQEGALFGLLHNLRGLGATPVACAGISLMGPVIRDMYKTMKNEKVQKLFEQDQSRYQDNQCAIDMARSVGKYVAQTFQSDIFQSIKHYIKL
jgi:multimeric flavodoxin WrbA